MATRYPSEFLKGTTPVLILDTMKSRELCGFDLVQAIRERSRHTLEIAEGTIYPLLYRLEGKGLIQGAWKAQEGRRSEKVYRLTERGRKYLKEQKDLWKKFAESISFFMGGGK